MNNYQQIVNEFHTLSHPWQFLLGLDLAVFLGVVALAYSMNGWLGLLPILGWLFIGANLICLMESLLEVIEQKG